MKKICISQLREIDGANEEWAMANGKRDGDEVELAGLIELLKAKKPTMCPQGGLYWIGTVGAVSRCAIAEHNLER